MNVFLCHIRGLWPKSSYSTDVFSQRKPGEPAADGAHKHSWPYQFVYAVLNSWSKTKLLVVTEQFLRFPLPLLTLELLRVPTGLCRPLCGLWLGLLELQRFPVSFVFAFRSRIGLRLHISIYHFFPFSFPISIS